MTEKSVDLMQVTSTNDTHDITSSTIDISNTTDVFVNQVGIELLPVDHSDGVNNDVIQRDSVEDAGEDELSNIQSCLSLTRKLNSSCNISLSKYSLSKDDSKMAKKKSIKLWNTLFRYFSNTSFHGLPHIAGSKRSYCRLTYWIIILLLSLGLMFWAVIAVTMQYAEMNTVLFSKRLFNERLQFPAVTICNKNLYRKSVASNVGLNVNEVRVLRLDTFTSPPFVRVNDLFDYNYTVTQYKSLFNQVDSAFYFNNSGHQIKEMLFECRFGREGCSTHNFVRRTSTNGNCYTFNSGEDESTTLYSTEGGYRFGLELILNAEQYEYFLVDSDSVGFNVFIHDQDHFPYFGSAKSFSLSAGQLTQVSLRKVDYYLQTPTGGGQCNNEITLKYFKSYSRISCIAECFTDYVVGICNCKWQGMPGPAEVCGLIDSCMHPTGKVSQFNQDNCNCPLSCHTTEYEMTLSYARFPADHITTLLNNSNTLSLIPYSFPEFLISNATSDDGAKYSYLNENFTESFLSKNFAKVFIYYDELVSTTIEEGLEYSTFQFFADFGGHIGLFTGAGFLTLFEIMDLCYSMIRPTDE